MATYSLGHSTAEQQRLRDQAAFLAPVTAHIWRKAGLAPGMRVLDVGCGVGDTTFLAAEIVGPSGSVLGVDRSQDALATARDRDQAQHSSVKFLQAEVGDSLPHDAPFDAIVGRYVLVHQPSIAATLASLRPLVRSGGILAFHEVELDLRLNSSPASPFATSIYALLADACRLGGMQVKAVSQMPRYFHEAGLPWPDTELHPLVGSGPDSYGPRYVADLLTILAPILYQAGLATPAALDTATLETRLRGACKNGEASMSHVNGGAWIRVP